MSHHGGLTILQGEASVTPTIMSCRSDKGTLHNISQWKAPTGHLNVLVKCFTKNF